LQRVAEDRALPPARLAPTTIAQSGTLANYHKLGEQRYSSKIGGFKIDGCR